MKKYIIFIFLTVSLLFSQQPDFPYISLTTTGVKKFLKRYPNYNGDGVVVFVLDSGVDPGVEGLRKLPDGSIKVIDTQDFSGEGDVYLSKAVIETDKEGAYLSANGAVLRGFDKLETTPVDSAYYLGKFEESRLKNSAVFDLNHNGRDDDVFTVLVMKTLIKDSIAWVALLDADADGNIDDEKAVRDYKINFDTIELRGRDPKYAQNLVTLTLNIFPGEMRVSLHFADNAHGSHCAGIATGYNINGQKGFNGVAPGARVISLKIGNNTLSGGATVTESMKKAFEYAREYAEKHPEYFYVMNMSYGIGSEIEGKSSIDQYLDDFFSESTELTLCTSNGNEGPGISTAGTPSAAERVISVGAVLPKETSRDLFGFYTKRDVIFYFSSRGGDIDKPDVVAPGAASSTVPYYARRATMWGTSMASPHAAGSVALLLSALKKSFPGKVPHNQIIKRALKNSARPLAGYNWLDYGAGMIDVPAAWKRLKRYYEEIKKTEDLVNYAVSAPSSEFDRQKGRTVFFRANGYYPLKQERISVSPVFPAHWDADRKAKYFENFKILTTGDLVSVRESEKYIKGKAPASIHFTLKPEKKPGIYTGMIYGIPEDQSRSRENAVFSIPVAVINPYRFLPENGETLSFRAKSLAAGEIQRYYVQVDEDATALRVDLHNNGAPDNTVRLYIFDQEGRNVKIISGGDKNSSVWLLPQKRDRGIWEFVFWPHFHNRSAVSPSFTLTQYRVGIVKMTNREMNYEAGKNPEGKITIVNPSSVAYNARWSGKIIGYVAEKSYNIQNDNFRLPLKAESFVDRIDLEMEILDDDFEKVTDLAVNIIDMDGRAVEQDGFTYKHLKMSLYPEKGKEYSLEFVAAFTNAYENKWKLRIRETRYYEYSYAVYIYPDQISNLKILPGHSMDLEFEVTEPLPTLPKKYRYKMKLEYLDERNNLRVPLYFPEK